MSLMFSSPFALAPEAAAADTPDAGPDDTAKQRLMPLDTLLEIDPKSAVAKFLVDMRIAAERSCRRWNKVLSENLAERGLTLAERRRILDQYPLEDTYFAGLVAVQAWRVRELFSFSAGEALMRELALQVDAAVGRDDNLASSLVFIILGRIRKAHLAENRCDHDQAVAALLERIGLAKDPRTAPILICLAARHSLAEPLAVTTPLWWDSFVTIYNVNVTALRPMPRRADTVPMSSDRGRSASERGRATQAPATTGTFSFAAWLTGAKPPASHLD